MNLLVFLFRDFRGFSGTFSYLCDSSDIVLIQNEELKQLVHELRSDVIFNVSRTGGHLGLILGVVELTVALHYVFNAPLDRILWDVGHQVSIFPCCAVINANESGASFPLKKRDLMLDYILTLMGRDDNDGFADSSLELLHTQLLVSSRSLPLECISAQLLRAALADSNKLRPAAGPGRMSSSFLLSGLQLFFCVVVHYILLCFCR
ncbi:hypothetical protein MRB53_035500 [Persea americana]|uniref:Uncharacterized protein n=1 Tax=Persea americana TaxID=3435 RepID=A0ACC2K543_PERAE|nr:hypothetical protein MRB53_035500 [Persea americana]